MLRGALFAGADWGSISEERGFARIDSTGPDNCRVANNSAWRLSARWRADHRSSCWTSRFRLWIGRRKIRCTTCFARSQHMFSGQTIHVTHNVDDAVSLATHASGAG